VTGSHRDRSGAAVLEAVPFNVALKHEVLPVSIDAQGLVIEAAPTSDTSGFQERIGRGLKVVEQKDPRWRESLPDELRTRYTLGADRRALARVKPPVAVACDALPLRIEEGLEPKLVVAMANPGDADKFALLHAHARMELKVQQFPREALRNAIRLAYRLDEMLALRAQRRRRAPVRQQLDDLILECFDQGGQNLILRPTPDGGQACYKIDGVVHPRYDYEKRQYDDLITSLYNVAVGKGASDDIGEGQYTLETHLKTIYARVVTLKEEFCGQLGVLRLHDLDTQPMTFADAGMTGEPAKQMDLAMARNSGAFVYVGPGDAGKTMSAIAMFREFQRRKNGGMNILGLGDPPEFYVSEVLQTALHPSRPYQAIIGAFLRAAADGMLCGEVRTVENAGEVFDAAQAGGITALTTHADDAIVAVNKLAKGVERTTLAGIVRAIVGQRLLRRLCIVCREASSNTLPDGRAEKYHVKHNNDGTLGCPACAFTGYSGRVGIFEVLRFNKAVALAVERGAGPLELERIAGKYGYRPMVYDAYDKVAAGVTDLNEIERVLSTHADDSQPEDLV
jgi:general secretion pathway protein E